MSHDRKPELSVVIPAYNEAKRIGLALETVTSNLNERGATYEIIVVDDGSTDSTKDIVQNYADTDSRIKLIGYGRNRGKGCAVRFGMLEAHADDVLFIDADPATPIQDLHKLQQAAAKGYDLVIGSRNLRDSSVIGRQPWYRELSGRVFNLIIRPLAVPGIRDTQCGFKYFKGRSAARIFSAARLDGPGFHVEALYLARKYGYHIIEVPVLWETSPATKVSVFRHSLPMLTDILRVRLNDWRARYDQKPPETVDRPPCILCGSLWTEPLYTEAGVIKCANCGLVRVEKIPTRREIEDLYSEGYFRSSDSAALGYDDYAADRKKILRTFETRMDQVEEYLGRAGRLLDVGCAMGFSLEVAQRRGWETRGIEISRFACEYARNQLGLDVFCGSLAEADFPHNSFDVVTMWDYIEHSPDPAEELIEAHRVLKPRGLLIITTPDINSLPSRVWRSRWMMIKQEEHLYYFSPATFNKLLSKCGFETVRLKHVGKYIDTDFFAKRAGLYSKAVERIVRTLTQALGIGHSMLYVNPLDNMMVWAKKADTTEWTRRNTASF